VARSAYDSKGKHCRSDAPPRFFMARYKLSVAWFQ